MFKIKDKNLGRLLKIALFLRFILFFLVLISFFIFPFCYSCYEANFVYPSSEKVSLKTLFKTWDAQHYLFLAEKGYMADSPNTTFYPLYPALIWLLRIFFKDSFLSGIFLSNFLFFISLVYFYQLTKKIFNQKIAFKAALFLLVFPTAFYFNLIYTESLFFFLLMVYFYYSYKPNFLLRSVAAFLLPLSRPQGLWLLINELNFLLESKKFNFKIKKVVFSLFFFLLGFLVYLLIMKYFSGSFFSGFTGHKYFISNRSLSNLWHPWRWFLENFIFLNYSLHGFTNSLIDRIFFCVFLILLLPAYKILDKNLFLYCLIGGLLPALSDHFMSYSRYLVVVFPLFIILAKLCKKKDDFIFIAGMMFLCQIIFGLRHSLNYWVG